MSSLTSPEPGILQRQRYYAVLSVTLLDGLSIGVVLPLLPFLVLHFGAKPVVVTQLVALYALANFLANPILGYLSDQFGRFRLVMLSLVGTVLSFVGILLSWSLVGVFAFRILGGLLAGRGPVLRAQLTDGLSKEGHVRPLTSLATATTVGIVGGPIIASVVASLVRSPTSQYRVVLMLAVACSLAALLAYIIAFRAGDAVGKRPQPSQKNALFQIAWKLRLPLLLTFAMAVAQGVIFSTTALLVHERFSWGIRETGWLLASQAVIAVVCRAAVITPLTKAIGLRHTFAASAALALLALWGVAVSYNYPAFVAAMTIFAIGYSIANVLPVVMISEASPAGVRGLSLGLQQGLIAGTLALTASTSGALFQYVWSGAPHLIASGVIVGALAVLGWSQLAAMRAARLVPQPATPILGSDQGT